MKKKLLALPITAMLGMMLTGCSIPGFGSGPSTATDVVEKYNALMAESCNYHANMDLDLDIQADAQGISINLPVYMGLSVDVMDGNMHGDVELSMTFMGEKVAQSMEIYTESGKRSSTTYSYDSEEGYWVVSEDEDSAGLAVGFIELDVSSFEDAAMEYDKADKTYTITQSFSDFADSNSVYDIIEEMSSSMTEMVSMDSDDMLDAWMDAEIVYVFDENFYLSSVTLEGCEYSDTITNDGLAVDVSVELGLLYEFSDYGQIKESDVEVPSRVVKSAVPSISIDADDMDIDINVDINDDDDYEDEFPNENEEPSYEEPSHDEPIDEDPIQKPVAAVSGDMLGSYNGVALTVQGDSWEDTFGADGWEFANDDAEYIFMTATNEKYDGVDLYVYNYDRTKVTKSSILEGGIWGYDVECSWADSYPAMTWNGVTFGDSADKIIEAYGQPHNIYEGTMYTSYLYEITEDIEIEFYVFSGEGLQHVNVSFYGGL